MQVQTGKLNMEKLFCGDEEEEAAKPQVKVGKLNRSLQLEMRKDVNGEISSESENS